MANPPNARPDRARLLREVLAEPPYDHDAATRGRIAVATLLVLGVFVLLGFHLYKIQCVKHETFLERRNEQSIATVSTEARRGSIFDRHGRPLALSRLVKSVYAVPEQVEDVRETANALSRILGMDAQEIAARLVPKDGEENKQFVWIKR
ncbi:MAG: hypothetical protein RDV41_14605, partial [Planctomycetota bacterium]|nr:hypothetical protein [Planctomycetota bacterium]